MIMWKKFRFGAILWAVWFRFLMRLFFGGMYIDQVLTDPFTDYTTRVGQHFWVVEADVSDQSIDAGTGDVLDPEEAYEKLQEVMHVLDTTYMEPEKLNDQDMWDEAIRGYIDGVHDPYTVYLDKQENKSFGEALEWSQNFEGIGAVVSQKPDGVMIEEVLKESPAQKAGLQALDIVLKIDDTSTQDLDLYDAVAIIRGPSWSVVRLTIYREEEWEILEIDVTRWSIDVPSVEWEIFAVQDQQVLYIQMYTFGEDTASRLLEVIQTKWTDVDGVILDLRWNGGWILPIAVEVASYRLPEWDIVSRVDYTSYPDMVLKSKGYLKLQWLPTVILVDKWSASASEIVAGALRDDAWAVLLGETTFGKWSVQSIHPLSDGSSIKLSIGKRYTPNGVNVNEIGLTPDIEVIFDQELFELDETDNQLEEAKKRFGGE